MNSARYKAFAAGMKLVGNSPKLRLASVRGVPSTLDAGQTSSDRRSRARAYALSLVERAQEDLRGMSDYAREDFADAFDAALRLPSPARESTVAAVTSQNPAIEMWSSKEFE